MSKRQRDTWKFFDYHAICDVCGRVGGIENGLGVAARHYEATGHAVSVEVSGNVRYCGPEESARIRASRTDVPPAVRAATGKEGTGQ